MDATSAPQSASGGHPRPATPAPNDFGALANVPGGQAVFPNSATATNLNVATAALIANPYHLLAPLTNPILYSIAGSSQGTTPGSVAATANLLNFFATANALAGHQAQNPQIGSSSAPSHQTMSASTFMAAAVANAQQQQQNSGAMPATSYALLAATHSTMPAPPAQQHHHQHPSSMGDSGVAAGSTTSRSLMRSGSTQTSRKRPRDDSLRSSSSSSAAKLQRVASYVGDNLRQQASNISATPSNQPRIDTPPPIMQDPIANMTNQIIEAVSSMANATAAQQQHQRHQQTLTSQSLAAALFHHQSQQHQQQNQSQSQSAPCPVCHRQVQLTTPGSSQALLPQSVVSLAQQNVALRASSSSSSSSAFALSQYANSLPSLDGNTTDESNTTGGAEMCSGYHCAHCVGAGPPSVDQMPPPPPQPQQQPSMRARQDALIMAILQRHHQEQQQAADVTNYYNSIGAATSNAAMNPPPQALILQLQQQQQQQQQQQVAGQTPRIQRAPQQQQLQAHQYAQIASALPAMQSSTAAALNRSLPHHLTRSSSLSASNPFANAANTHPDHLNLMNARQQIARSSNDVYNRFYSTSSIVVPPQGQQTQQQAAPSQTQQQPPQAAPSTGNLPIDFTTNTLNQLAAMRASTRFVQNITHHPSLLFLSEQFNQQNIHPMILFQHPSAADYMPFNPEANAHTVAMHHAPEPQPVGATSDQIKRCTQIRNYVKDQEVPEQERERCTVCLMDFETGDDIRTLNCSHMYHIDCIDRWLAYNKKCPVCRVDMDKLPMIITENEVEEALSSALTATAQ